MKSSIVMDYENLFVTSQTILFSNSIAVQQLLDW